MSKLLILNKRCSQSLLMQFALHMPKKIWLDLNYNWSLPAVNNISEGANSSSNKPIKFADHCEPRHWNLGIGIGIGTRIGNILQTPLFPVSYGLWTSNFAEWWLKMKAKLPTKPRDTSISWSLDKSKTLYFHFRKAYGPQT